VFMRRAGQRAAARWVPMLGVAMLAWLGHAGLALGLFVLVFVVVGYLTLSTATRLLGPVTTRLPNDKGVLISIDDGPCPETTLALLDVLDRYEARALFFLVGERVQRWPELAREIVRRGHTIGNHTQRHRVATFWGLGALATWREIADCQATLESVLGESARPRWFRAPVGHYNLFTHPALEDLEMQLMSWSCRGYDGVDNDVPRVLRRLESGLEPGAIVLLHDATKGAAEVLEGLLRMMQARGLGAASGH
jgi:peptidoglycan/xylan/chitin deacetylase (PgdA/CDA1 family)